MTKSILFDLDGTLTDSCEGILNSTVYALNQLNVEIPSDAQLHTVIGPPLSDSFARFHVPQDQISVAVEHFHSRYIPEGMFENRPYDGIRELLEKLRADGHKLYVATSKPEWMAVKILEYFDLAKYFETICGAVSDFVRNSKDAVIEYLLTECNMQGNVIMVGDTAYDVTGAKVHGIPCIGVDWGYGLNEDMEKAGAVAIAYTMDQLYDLLK